MFTLYAPCHACVPKIGFIQLSCLTIIFVPMYIIFSINIISQLLAPGHLICPTEFLFTERIAPLKMYQPQEILVLNICDISVLGTESQGLVTIHVNILSMHL